MSDGGAAFQRRKPASRVLYREVEEPQNCVVFVLRALFEGLGEHDMDLRPVEQLEVLLEPVDVLSTTKVRLEAVGKTLVSAGRNESGRVPRGSGPPRARSRTRTTRSRSHG